MRVVDMGGGIASAYCAKLLGDLGADVVAVEPPTGDPLRTYGPVPACSPERGSGLFQYLSGGKRSTIFDLSAALDPASRARLAHLITTADIVIERLGLGVLEKHFDLEPAGAEPPVLVRISPFGQTGPYRDLPAKSLVVQAAGGWVARIGTPEGPPYHVGGLVEEYVAGTYAAAAALTALRHAASRGEAARIDLSIFECVAGTIPYPMLQTITFERLGFPVPQRYQPIPGIVRCADGFVGISALTGQHWADVCAILELPELAEKMREVTLRGEEWRSFLAKAEPWLAARTSAEVVELFQVVRVPAVPIGDGRNLTSLEPFVSRSYFVAQPDGGFLRPGSPFRMSGSPVVAARPAPRLGEHDEELFAGLDMLDHGSRSEMTSTRVRSGSAETGRTEAARAETNGPQPPAHPKLDEPAPAATSSWGGGRPGLPFSGLKVLDLTSFWAGPYLTMYLASFGADVIKVESPKRPDGFRFVAAFPQLGPNWWEQSGVFHATNLGKRSLALDLDDRRGRELIERLVADADVVAENYSPRVLEHFGLTYETIRALNARAILLRMPGFGLEGPCRDWVGWALTFEQMAGCANMTGEPGGRMFAPGGFADPVVGMHAAVALQAALAHRQASGEGQQIEIAQVEVVAALTAEQVIRDQLSGEYMTRTGNRSTSAAPQGVYRCAGRDEWIAISVRSDDEWQRFCRTMQDDTMAHATELADAESRARNHDAVDARISKWAAGLSAADAARLLHAAGIPAAPVLRTEDFYGDPQLAARSYFQAIEHPICGELRYPGWPMRVSFLPDGPHAGPAPTLGQHGERILRDVLGLSAHEIDALRAARVIGAFLDQGSA